MAVEVMLEIGDAVEYGGPVLATNISKLRVADTNAPAFWGHLDVMARRVDVILGSWMAGAGAEFAHEGDDETLELRQAVVHAGLWHGRGRRHPCLHRGAGQAAG